MKAIFALHPVWFSFLEEHSSVPNPPFPLNLFNKKKWGGSIFSTRNVLLILTPEEVN